MILRKVVLEPLFYIGQPEGSPLGASLSVVPDRISNNHRECVVDQPDVDRHKGLCGGITHTVLECILDKWQEDAGWNAVSVFISRDNQVDVCLVLPTALF